MKNNMHDRMHHENVTLQQTLYSALADKYDYIGGGRKNEYSKSITVKIF